MKLDFYKQIIFKFDYTIYFMELHPYEQARLDAKQEMGIRIIIDVSIEDALQFLYDNSPLKDSNYERISNDLIKFLRKINDNLKEGLDGPKFRTEYTLGVVGHQFLDPLLEVHADNEREQFCKILEEDYDIYDSLDMHFENPIEDEENIGLEKIVKDLQEERKEIFKHDPSKCLRDKIFHYTSDRINDLQDDFSLDKYVLTLGCFLLSSAFGNDPNRGDLSEKFDKACDDHPKYVLISDAKFRET